MVESPPLILECIGTCVVMYSGMNEYRHTGFRGPQGADEAVAEEYRVSTYKVCSIQSQVCSLCQRVVHLRTWDQ